MLYSYQIKVFELIRLEKKIVCFPFHGKIFMGLLGGKYFHFMKYFYMERIEEFFPNVNKNF